MLKALEQTVGQWLKRAGFLQNGEKALLAVSGGADSMAMLHVLLRLREEGMIRAEFAVGHVNHQLRGRAADADQRFVEQFAEQQGLEVISRVVNVPAFAQEHKLSLETAGRMLRIRMLSEMARQCGAQCAATAHQKNDQAETIVHRLLRGTGFRGLCGIRPSGLLEGVKFIRPMLGVRRQEILTYCEEENLPWRQDHTNADCGFTRNRIRRKMLPYLQEQTPSDLVERLTDLSEKGQRLFERIDAEIEKKMFGIMQFKEPESIVLKKAALAGCSPIVLGEILQRCLIQLKVGLRDYTARHYQQMMRCIYDSNRMKCRLPGNIECAANDQFLTFRKGSGEKQIPDEPVWLEVGTACRFGPFQITSALLELNQVTCERFRNEKSCRVERLDADEIKGPIRIRARKAGDCFRPLGMKSDKKVGKFLTAARVDSDLKDRIFILEDSEKILWVAPVRICEQAKVTEQTRRILQLSVKE